MKDRILKALNLNALAYETVKQKFERGMSENDIKDIILSAASGAEDYSGDIIGGIRSAEIEGDATDYALKDGDCLILDLQFKLNNVWTDTTRTFFIGTPNDEVKRAYELCRYAKHAGESALKADVQAFTVYNAVKSAFEPYAQYFPHHAGHLFGESVCVQPQLLPDKYEYLKAGDFVTLEPGIYFKNKFGIRVEDNYHITENGADNLFNYPINMEYFII